MISGKDAGWDELDWAQVHRQAGGTGAGVVTVANLELALAVGRGRILPELETAVFAANIDRKSKTGLPKRKCLKTRVAAV